MKTRHSFLFFSAHTLLALVAIAFIVAIPHELFAAEKYEPLVNLPGVTNTNTGNLPQYLNNIYLILIGVGALIATFKIMIAGIKYSMSGIITDKAAARSDIRGALFGLALLLVPFIVLNTINPELTNFNFLRNADKVKIQPTNTGGATGGWGDPSDPIDYETTTLTLTQEEFNTYSENDIISWYGRCGGEDKLKIAVSGGMVTLSCSN